MSENKCEGNEIQWMKEAQPRLKDKELLKSRVLSKILTKPAEQKFLKRNSFFLMRVASSILLLISIGSYTWQETDVQLKRLQMNERINETLKRSISIKNEFDCKQSLHQFLVALDKVSLEPLTDGRNVYLTLDNIVYLKEHHSVLFKEVNSFLFVLKELYPQEYRSFCVKGTLQLSLLQLKNNQKLCEWFK